MDRTSKEWSVHLAHLKEYYPRETPPAPLFNRFLGKRISLPGIDRPDGLLPRVETCEVEKVLGYAPGPGQKSRKSRHNYEYRLRVEGYGPAAHLT